MVHFVDSSSNKKATLTVLDKEDDPIEGVTVQVDMPMPQPFRYSLLDDRLTNSCWSVESTRDI